jgi:hypothetical protein
MAAKSSITESKDRELVLTRVFDAPYELERRSSATLQWAGSAEIKLSRANSWARIISRQYKR